MRRESGKVLYRRGVLRRGKILPDGFEIPERGIDRVVFRLTACVWEIVRQHSSVHVSRKGKKDLPGHARASGRERQSRQRNHGVAAPVPEPVIAGDDAPAIRLFRKAALTRN